MRHLAKRLTSGPIHLIVEMTIKHGLSRAVAALTTGLVAWQV